ncbi:PRP38-domain-containing protein [Stemphylium lycopersici]|nr:pre-mrna-splicing factor 38a [Stemphylium lycopersici]RAR01292.1 PRP38-domain-containing protein [Stemphylium lycopersici]
MSKPQFDRADASALLDDRGYRGALIRGQNPALLFEKGVRERITESYYWKEQCFGLNAATLCDRAADLKFIGGTTGITGKPTPFLCLAFKMLQLVPDKDIILEYLNFRDDEDDQEPNAQVKNEHGDTAADEEEEEEDATKKELDLNASGKLGDFKYLRCLAAFYIRLAWEPVEIYQTLEPLLTDYRKIKRRLKDTFTLTHVDQFIDDLLTKDRICATSLWKLPSRANLEDLEMLDPRESPLGDEVDELDEELDRRTMIAEAEAEAEAMTVEVAAEAEAMTAGIEAGVAVQPSEADREVKPKAGVEVAGGPPAMRSDKPHLKSAIPSLLPATF